MAEKAFELELELSGKRFRNAALGLQLLADRWDTALGQMTPIARREMIHILDTVIEAMRKRHSTRWAPNQRLAEGDDRGRLAQRSGGSLSGLKRKITTAGDDVTGVITVPAPLGIHEDGATIRKKSKMLAIPLPAALNSRGIPIKPGPRSWPNTFVAESRAGNVLIFQRQGRTVVPLYILRDETKIPRRLGMGTTLRKAAPLYVERVFEKSLQAIQMAMKV